MIIKKIKNKKQYLESLERFEEIFQSVVGTKESDEADLLAFLGGAVVPRAKSPHTRGNPRCSCLGLPGWRRLDT